MHPTLVEINWEPFGWPMFGFGWLLGAWLVIGALLMVWLVRRQGMNRDTLSYIPVILLVAGGIVAAQWIVLKDSQGNVVGLPIRGYGAMVLVATVAGIGVAVLRARRMGLNPELIYTLAFWMFVCGIIGARVFFVVQNWPQFRKPTIAASLGEILKFTEGGLVVYGGVFGGLLAAGVFVVRRGLPLLAVGDLIAPSMLLGMGIGRIGCLLNGCCWGGDCDGPLCVRFPKGSPPYLDQLERGPLLGLSLDSADSPPRIRSVTPGSLAADAGVTPGDEVLSIKVASSERFRMSTYDGSAEADGVTLTTNNRVAQWTIAALPERSLPVAPAQIYATINGVVSFLLLWFLYPFRTRDGQVFATMLTLYPVLRILEEIIRIDEPGRFGTPLSISQFISLGILLLAAVVWLYIWRAPRRLALPVAPKVSSKATSGGA